MEKNLLTSSSTIIFFEYKSNVFAKSCFDFLNSIFYLSAHTNTRYKFPIENTVDSRYMFPNTAQTFLPFFSHMKYRREMSSFFGGLRVCCVGGEKKVNAFSRRAGEIKGRFVRSKEEEEKEKRFYSPFRKGNRWLYVPYIQCSYSHP